MSWILWLVAGIWAYGALLDILALVVDGVFAALTRPKDARPRHLYPTREDLGLPPEEWRG